MLLEIFFQEDIPKIILLNNFHIWAQEAHETIAKNLLMNTLMGAIAWLHERQESCEASNN